MAMYVGVNVGCVVGNTVGATDGFGVGNLILYVGDEVGSSVG